MSSMRLPASAYRLTASGDRQPASGDERTASAYRLTASGNRRSADGRRRGRRGGPEDPPYICEQDQGGAADLKVRPTAASKTAGSIETRIGRAGPPGPRRRRAGLQPRRALAAIFVAAHAWLFGAALCASAAEQTPPDALPTRVVSLVPAVTEMLFAMGAGDRVVGVSSFDRHPPEAASRARVGGLIDPDLERILSLRPDLVVVYASQKELRQQLRRAAIPTFDYRHAGLADVTETIRVLGHRVGAAVAAEHLATSIERRIAAVSKAVGGRPRPRAALVFGRQPLSLRNVYVSGGVGFLHDLLAAAGADNVFADVARESFQATTETFLARSPELIVELHYARPMTADDLARERRIWDALPGVSAVREGRIVQLVGDEFVVPGPRVAEACERLARTIHPEAFH